MSCILLLGVVCIMVALYLVVAHYDDSYYADHFLDQYSDEYYKCDPARRHNHLGGMGIMGVFALLLGLIGAIIVIYVLLNL